MTRFDGFGLGLFVCRRLAESLGGSIVATSGGLGAGSTFTVLLPAYPAKAADVKTPPSSSSPVVALVWVDHEHTYRILSAPLEKAGIRVLPPCDALGAVVDELPTAAATATADSQARVIIFTELANVTALRSARGGAPRYGGIVVLTYAQSWQVYPEKEHLVPLFKPLRGSLVLAAVQSALLVEKRSGAADTESTPAAVAAVEPMSASKKTTPTGVKRARILIVDDNEYEY